MSLRSDVGGILVNFMYRTTSERKHARENSEQMVLIRRVIFSDHHLHPDAQLLRAPLEGVSEEKNLSFLPSDLRRVHPAQYSVRLYHRPGLEHPAVGESAVQQRLFSSDRSRLHHHRLLSDAPALRAHLPAASAANLRGHLSVFIPDFFRPDPV